MKKKIIQWALRHRLTEQRGVFGLWLISFNFWSTQGIGFHNQVPYIKAETSSHSTPAKKINLLFFEGVGVGG